MRPQLTNKLISEDQVETFRYSSLLDSLEGSLEFDKAAVEIVDGHIFHCPRVT